MPLSLNASVGRIILFLHASSEIYFLFIFPVFALTVNSSHKLFVSQD